MLGRVLPCLTVAASASMLPACNPPILLEGKTGWQPRSEIYVVRYLEEPQREEPLPNSWALIDRREMHPALRTATSTSSYDMVFFERMKGGGYQGGSALYVWADEQQSPQSAEQLAARLVEQFSRAPLVKLLPGAPDRGCPCSANVSRANPIKSANLAGVEQVGSHSVGGDGGDNYGFYLAVVRNPKQPPPEGAHVVVLFLAPSARFPRLLRDASHLVRRIRWQ